MKFFFNSGKCLTCINSLNTPSNILSFTVPILTTLHRGGYFPVQFDSGPKLNQTKTEQFSKIESESKSIFSIELNQNISVRSVWILHFLNFTILT